MREVTVGTLLVNPVGARPPVPQSTLRQRGRTAALESAEFCGRWWFDTANAQLRLSDRAARCLQVKPGFHPQCVDSFMAVVLDDLLAVVAHVSGASNGSPYLDFRVISPVDGLRWVRMCRLPADPLCSQVVSGTVVDITANGHTLAGLH